MNDNESKSPNRPYIFCHMMTSLDGKNSPFAAMAGFRYEHGKRGCFYDHRAGYKNPNFFV